MTMDELRKNRNNIFLYFVIFLAAWGIFYGVVSFFLSKTFPSYQTLFLSEKALIALQGEPPKVENVGIIEPLLPFLLLLLLNSPILAQSFSAALCLTSLIFVLKEKRIFLPILIFCSVPLVYLSVKDFSTLLCFTFFFLSLYQLHLYEKSNCAQFRHLFASALFYGFGFLCDYKIGFLLPLFIAYLSFIEWDAHDFSLQKLLSTSLIMITPVVFFCFLYFFLNFIFTDRFSLPFFNPYSSLTSAVTIYSGKFILSVIQFLKVAFSYYWFLNVPVIITLLFLERKALSFFIIILFISYGSIVYYFSGKDALSSSALLYLLSTISIFNAEKDVSLLSETIFILSIAISAILGYEYIGKEVFKKDEELLNFVEVASLLKRVPGICLLDDTELFPIVVFHSKVEDFLLPYQTSFTYNLSRLKKSIDTVIVSKKKNYDSIARSFPTSKYGFLEGFYVLYENESIIVYRNAEKVLPDIVTSVCGL